MNLPRTAVAAGSPVIVSVPASAELIDFVGELSRRSEKVRTRKVHPSVDNMLKITSEGRKATLDMRLVRPKLGELPYNKIDALAESVGRIYQRSMTNRGAQIRPVINSLAPAPGTATQAPPTALRQAR